MIPTVYLAGPIMGCSQAEANDWRIAVATQLDAADIRGVSPLRCEPLTVERYPPQNSDPKFGTARAIGSKNVFDVRRCDLTLAFFPAFANEMRPSYGTVIEIAWAHILGKPVVVVSDDPFILEHPVINACAGWILPNLDEAIELIIGVLGGYTIGGKNV